jgi:sarcosine oxidase subunit beta
VRLYERLSQDLSFNLMFSQHGHFTLAHSDRSLVVQQERAEVNKLLGIDSRVVDAAEVKSLCPQINVSPEGVTWPILGALYHPPGGIIRHDAVVWGFARNVDDAGVEIHQDTEVTGFLRQGNRVTGVRTAKGDVSAGVVLSATAGWSSIVARMAGLPLPIVTSILQAFVTEPVKPFLDKIIVSAQMHIYVSQTDRGEFLIGAEVEPYPTYSSKGTFEFVEYACRHVLELFPQLHATRILRHWTGLCDMSPDYSPIMGLTELDGFLVDCGWGTYGFKAAPIVGVTLAELIATGSTPALIEPFKLERFYDDRLVSELAAAAVSH